MMSKMSSWSICSKSRRSLIDMTLLVWMVSIMSSFKLYWRISCKSISTMRMRRWKTSAPIWTQMVQDLSNMRICTISGQEAKKPMETSGIKKMTWRSNLLTFKTSRAISTMKMKEIRANSIKCRSSNQYANPRCTKTIGKTTWSYQRKS